MNQATVKYSVQNTRRLNSKLNNKYDPEGEKERDTVKKAACASV